MIGGEGGTFQAPQQSVGGGNIGSNERRGAGASLEAFGSGSILVGVQPKGSTKPLHPSHEESKGQDLF